MNSEQTIQPDLGEPERAQALHRPNFFLLLGLSPNADWNQTLFEETLRKKRNEWSRAGSGVAKKALSAKQNLALIPKITEVMTNEAARESEAVVARQELASRRARRVGAI